MYSVDRMAAILHMVIFSLIVLTNCLKMAFKMNFSSVLWHAVSSDLLNVTIKPKRLPRFENYTDILHY